MLSAEEKKQELVKYKSLVIAAIDWTILTTAVLKSDSYNSHTHMESLKIVAQEYYGKGQLSKLKYLYSNFSKAIREKDELDFITFANEQTGYDIDLFKTAFKMIDGIIARGKITSDVQSYYTSVMIDYLRKIVPMDRPKIELLWKLYVEYESRGK